MLPHYHHIHNCRLKKFFGLLCLLIATWATLIGLALCIIALFKYADSIDRQTYNEVLFTMMYAMLAIFIGLLIGIQGRALLKQVYAKDNHLRD